MKYFGLITRNQKFTKGNIWFLSEIFYHVLPISGRNLPFLFLFIGIAVATAFPVAFKEGRRVLVPLLWGLEWDKLLTPNVLLKLLTISGELLALLPLIVIFFITGVLLSLNSIRYDSRLFKKLKMFTWNSRIQLQQLWK